MNVNVNVKEITETILDLERDALDRWNKGDVEGSLGIYADDVTYFDPITAKRIDGLSEMQEYFRSLWAGKVNIPS